LLYGELSYLVVGSGGGDYCSERTQRKTLALRALARVAAYVCARGKHRRSGQQRRSKKVLDLFCPSLFLAMKVKQSEKLFSI